MGGEASSAGRERGSGGEAGAVRASSYYYIHLIDHFLRTGRPDTARDWGADPLAAYLLSTMSDASVAALVLSDERCARIYRDTMQRFVSLSLEKARFRQSRSRGERGRLGMAASWSTEKRAEGWRVLLDALDERYGAAGFERCFYDHAFTRPDGPADDALWQTLMDDWQAHLDQRLTDETRRFVDERREAHDRLLRTNLTAAPRYADTHAVSAERFMQSWALLGGRWNALEFERLDAVVRQGARFPEMERIVRLMGRTAAPEGHRRIATERGAADALPHASGTDITGVGTGRSLSALLPSEWAQLMDRETEDIFFHKYVGERLQTFEHASRSLHAARSLRTRAARPVGPMVVCVDRSGSMQGAPQRLSLALAMRLAEFCYAHRRDCLLIAFAVDARPVDVLSDRTALLDFFRLRAEGDTDPRRMIALLLSSLSDDPRFVGADVLWVTDFRIPLAPSEQLTEMERLRREGTRFYGLQIGVAENRWTPHFDEILQISDVPMSVR